MYKLICNNISKSKGSLTSFTGPCKKVAQNYETHVRTKDYMSESDIGSKVRTSDKKNEPARVESEIQIKSASYNSFFTEEMKAVRLACPLLEVRKSSHSVRRISYSSAPSKNFYSSLVEHKSSSSKKKTFKNKEAVEMYRNALEQCNKIKCDRYKMGSIYRSATWFPRPIKPGYSWEEKEESQNAEKEGIVLENELEEAKQAPRPNMKRVVHIFQERRHMSTPINKEIENICQRKPNHQFKNKKVRITYPTHTVNYKIGLNKPYYLDQLGSQHSENPTYEDVTKVRNHAKGVSPADTLQVKYKSQQNLALLMKLRESPAERSEQPIEQTAENNVEEPVVKKHPTVEKGGRISRMAMSNKYSQLLSKIFTKNQEKSRQETIVEDKESRDNSLEELTKAEGQEPAEAYTEPIMIKHPLVVNKAQENINNIPLKYPKKVIVEKPDTFDIEGTCIKHKGASSKYGDYVVEIDRKAQSHTLAKEEETVDAEAEELKQHLNSLAETEELKCDARKVGKVPTRAESLAEYLKKLKELKDQTAINRIGIIHELQPTDPITKDVGQRVKIPGETIKTDVAKKIEEKRNRLNDQIRTEQTKDNEDIDMDEMAEVLFEKIKENKELFKNEKTFDKRKAKLQSFIPPHGKRSRETVKELVKKQIASKQKIRKIVYPTEDTSGKNTTIKLTLPKSQDITSQVVAAKMLEDSHKSIETVRTENLKNLLDQYKVNQMEVIEPNNQKEEIRLDQKNIKGNKEKGKDDNPQSGMGVNITIPTFPHIPSTSVPKKEKQPEPKAPEQKKHKYELTEYVKPVGEEIVEARKISEPPASVEAKMEKTNNVKDSVKAKSKASEAHSHVEKSEASLKKDTKVKKMEHRSKSMVLAMKTRKTKHEVKQIQESKGIAQQEVAEAQELSAGEVKPTVKRAKSEGSLEDILKEEREKGKEDTSKESEEKTPAVIEVVQLDSKQSNMGSIKEDAKEKHVNLQVEPMKKIKYPSESIQRTIQRDAYTKLKEAGQHVLEPAKYKIQEKPNRELVGRGLEEIKLLEGGKREMRANEELMSKNVDDRQKPEQQPKIHKPGGKMEATGDGNQNRRKGKTSPRKSAKMEAKEDADEEMVKKQKETKELSSTKGTVKKQDAASIKSDIGFRTSKEKEANKTREKRTISLENRPVIRHERPEPISKDRSKKDKPKSKKGMILPPKVHTKAEASPEDALMNDITNGAKLIDTLAAEYMSKCRSLAEILEQQKKDMLEEINKRLEAKSESDLLKKEKQELKRKAPKAASDKASTKATKGKQLMKGVSDKVPKKATEGEHLMKEISDKVAKQAIEGKQLMKVVREKKKAVEVKKEIDKEIIAKSGTDDDKRTGTDDVSSLVSKKTESKDLVPQIPKGDELMKTSEITDDKTAMALTNIDNEPTTPEDKDHKEMAISIANQKKNRKFVKELNTTSNATVVGVKDIQYEQGKPSKIIEKSPRIQKEAKKTDVKIMEEGKKVVKGTPKKAEDVTNKIREIIGEAVKEGGKKGVLNKASKKSVVNLHQKLKVTKEVPGKITKPLEKEATKQKNTLSLPTDSKHMKIPEKPHDQSYGHTEKKEKVKTRDTVNFGKKRMPTLNVVVKLNTTEKSSDFEEPKIVRKPEKVVERKGAKDFYKTWFQPTTTKLAKTLEKIRNKPYEKPDTINKEEIKDGEAPGLKVVVKLNTTKTPPKIEETTIKTDDEELLDWEPNIDADIKDDTDTTKNVERNRRPVLDYIYEKRKDKGQILEMAENKKEFGGAQKKIKKGSVIDYIYARDVYEEEQRSSVLEEIYTNNKLVKKPESRVRNFNTSKSESQLSVLEQIYGKQPPINNKETRQKTRRRSVSVLESIYGDEYDRNARTTRQALEKSSYKFYNHIFSTEHLKNEAKKTEDVKTEGKKEETGPMVIEKKPVIKEKDAAPKSPTNVQSPPVNKKHDKILFLNHFYSRKHIKFDVGKKEDVKTEGTEEETRSLPTKKKSEKKAAPKYPKKPQSPPRRKKDKKASFLDHAYSKEPPKFNDQKKEEGKREDQTKSLVTETSFLDHAYTKKPPKFNDQKKEEEKREDQTKSLVTGSYPWKSQSPPKSIKKGTKKLTFNKVSGEITIEKNVVPHITSSKELKKVTKTRKSVASIHVKEKPKHEENKNEPLRVYKNKNSLEKIPEKRKYMKKGESEFKDITGNLIKQLAAAARNAAGLKPTESKKELDEKQKNTLAKKEQLRTDSKVSASVKPEIKDTKSLDSSSLTMGEEEIKIPLIQPPRYNQIVKKTKSVTDEEKQTLQPSRKIKTSTSSTKSVTKKGTPKSKTKVQVVEKKDLHTPKSMKGYQSVLGSEDQTRLPVTERKPETEKKVVAPKSPKKTQGPPSETSLIAKKNDVEPDIPKSAKMSQSERVLKEDQTRLPVTEMKPVVEKKVVAPKSPKKTQGPPSETSLIAEKKDVEPDIPKSAKMSQSERVLKEDQTRHPVTEIKPITKEKEMASKTPKETQDSPKMSQVTEKKDVERDILKSAKKFENFWSLKEDPARLPVTEIKSITEVKQMAPISQKIQDSPKGMLQVPEIKDVEPDIQKSAKKSEIFWTLKEDQARLPVTEIKSITEVKQMAPKLSGKIQDTPKEMLQVTEKKDVKPDILKSAKKSENFFTLKEDQARLPVTEMKSITEVKQMAPKLSGKIQDSPKEMLQVTEKKDVERDILKSTKKSENFFTLKEDQARLPVIEIKSITKEKQMPPKLSEKIQDSPNEMLQITEKKDVKPDMLKSAKKSEIFFTLKEDQARLPVIEIKSLTEEKQMPLKLSEKIEDSPKEMLQVTEKKDVKPDILKSAKKSENFFTLKEDQARLLVTEMKPVTAKTEVAPNYPEMAQGTPREKQTSKLEPGNKEEQEMTKTEGNKELSSADNFRLDKMPSLEDLMKIEIDKRNQEDKVTKAGKRQKVIIELTREPCFLTMLAKGQHFVNEGRSKTSPSLEKIASVSKPQVKIDQQKKPIDLEETVIYKKDKLEKDYPNVKEINEESKLPGIENQLSSRSRKSEKRQAKENMVINEKVLKNKVNFTTAEKNNEWNKKNVNANSSMKEKSKQASTMVQCSPSNAIERHKDKEAEEAIKETPPWKGSMTDSKRDKKDEKGKKDAVPSYMCSSNDTQKQVVGDKKIKNTVSEPNIFSDNKINRQTHHASTSLAMSSSEKPELATIIENCPCPRPIRPEEVAACYYKYLADDLLQTKLSKHLASKDRYQKSNNEASEFLKDLSKNEIPNFFRKYIFDEQIQTELTKYLCNNTYFQKAMIVKQTEAENPFHKLKKAQSLPVHKIDSAATAEKSDKTHQETSEDSFDIVHDAPEVFKSRSTGHIDRFKDKSYKNDLYFSYHQKSYYDLELYMSKLRTEGEGSAQ